MNSLLVIGGSGFIGGRLVAAAAGRGRQVFRTYHKRDIDLPGTSFHINLAQSDTSLLQHCMSASNPDAVVYCAAASSAAELHEQAAVSSCGLRNVLNALREVRPDAFVCFLSTNAVFGNNGPYNEHTPPTPELRTDALRNYALAKAEAENILLDEWNNAVVARTATVMGRMASGELSRRLHDTVSRLRAAEVLARFTDRIISPTVVDDVVGALLEITEPLFPHRGVLHLAGRDKLSDFEYTSKIARRLGVDSHLVQPDSIETAPAMAGSPRDTSLDIEYTSQCLCTNLHGVDEQLEIIFGQ